MVPVLMTNRRILLAAILCSGLARVAPTRADEDADRAREALERGEIRPLEEVLRAARAAVPGDVVAVDLKRDDGRWLYKLRILGPDGKRRSVKVEAQTLRILDEDDDD